MSTLLGRGRDRTGWLRQYHKGPADAPLLVFFPHAGGAATGYFGLSAAVSAAAQVEAFIVQYPGRQDRLAEACPDNIAEMADRAVEALLPFAEERRLVLFGHSMGSTVAFEVALRLEARAQGRGPLGLIVSGRGAASVQTNQGVHLLSDEDMTASMAALSGTPAALLADKDLMAAVLPALRADFKASELYQGTPGAQTRCPISAYSGKADRGVPVDELLQWREHTTGEFKARFFEGGHFYLQPREQEVSRSILDDVHAFSTGALVGSR
ncbi:thioesterase II family protein [Kitasatospora sp. NPDC006697]|uniref:thioesterase II family protein n=1 Tax=Kitasatospora sp. NPDC006697 TaxID=3364020 RepID=UPI0036BFB3FA